MRTKIRRTQRLAALALLASLAAALPANAMTLSERAPATKDITRISVSIPTSHKSRLERRGTPAYMINASARRTSVIAAAGRPVQPAQLLWLGVLMASMCGFALFFGRELTIRFPARRG